MHVELPECLGQVIAMESVLTLRTTQVLCVVHMATRMNIVTTIGKHPGNDNLGALTRAPWPPSSHTSGYSLIEWTFYKGTEAYLKNKLYQREKINNISTNTYNK